MGRSTGTIFRALYFVVTGRIAKSLIPDPILSGTTATPKLGSRTDHRPRSGPMQRPSYVVLVPALVCIATLAPRRALAGDHGHPPVAVHCSDLASDPRHGLASNPVIKSVTSQIIAASGGNASYCQVDVLFGTN